MKDFKILFGSVLQFYHGLLLRFTTHKPIIDPNSFTGTDISFQSAAKRKLIKIPDNWVTPQIVQMSKSPDFGFDLDLENRKNVHKFPDFQIWRNRCFMHILREFTTLPCILHLFNAYFVV